LYDIVFQKSRAAHRSVVSAFCCISPEVKSSVRHMTKTRERSMNKKSKDNKVKVRISVPQATKIAKAIALKRKAGAMDFYAKGKSISKSIEEIDNEVLRTEAIRISSIKGSRERERATYGLLLSIFKLVADTEILAQEVLRLAVGCESAATQISALEHIAVGGWLREQREKPSQN
jgi:hypothetical protein